MRCRHLPTRRTPPIRLRPSSRRRCRRRRGCRRRATSPPRTSSRRRVATTATATTMTTVAGRRAAAAAAAFAPAWRRARAREQRPPWQASCFPSPHSSRRGSAPTFSRSPLSCWKSSRPVTCTSPLRTSPAAFRARRRRRPPRASQDTCVYTWRLTQLRPMAARGSATATAAAASVTAVSATATAAPASMSACSMTFSGSLARAPSSCSMVASSIRRRRRPPTWRRWPASARASS